MRLFAAYAAADARQQHITARMDVDITAYARNTRMNLPACRKPKTSRLRYCRYLLLSKKKRCSAKKKSLETVHGVIGFRTVPQAETRKGFTWGAVTNLLREFLPVTFALPRSGQRPFAADRDVPETAGLFEKVGIFVDQEETFYVEPKKENVEMT